MEGYDFVIYREWTQTGCEMEDGSDTRKDSYKIRVIAKHQEEQYLEDCADEYGSQDYSYRFDTKKIAELSYHDILAIAHDIIMAIEIHDVVNDRDKYEQIANKLQHMLEFLENDDKNAVCKMRGSHDYTKSDKCAVCGKTRGG